MNSNELIHAICLQRKKIDLFFYNLISTILNCHYNPLEN